MSFVLGYAIATLPGGLKIGMYPRVGNRVAKHGAAYFKVYKKTGNEPDPSATLLIEDLSGTPPYNNGITEEELKQVRLWASQNLPALRKNWELCKQGIAPQKITAIVQAAAQGLWVRRFEIVQDFIIKLVFSNGEIKYLDFEPLLSQSDGQVKEILNRELFRQVKLEDGTLLWPNGIDFDPDSLYDLSSLVEIAASSE